MKKAGIDISSVSTVIVDDEEHCISLLEEYLTKDPRIVITAGITDPGMAVDKILSVRPDLLFLDIQMPGMTGFDILEILSRTTVRPVVIFITAFDNYAIQAIRASAFDYLLKPVDRLELALSVERGQIYHSSC